MQAKGESETAQDPVYGVRAGRTIEGATFLVLQGVQRNAHDRGVGDAEEIAGLETGNSNERKDQLSWRRRSVSQLKVDPGGAKYR